MKTRLLAISFGIILASCDDAVLAADIAESTSHPFIGCWEDSTGLNREVWMVGPSGWIIGYAANRNAEGDVTFFEHMRIERKDGKEVLVVSGQDDSTTRFTRHMVEGSFEFIFENSEHDYPQIIAYKRSGHQLSAYISRLDGTDKVTFDKMSCKGD